jgi:hypothetical protein
MASMLLSLLVAAAAVTAMAPAAAQETPMGVTSLAEAKAMYQHDVAACKSGAVPQPVKTCLLEAARAYEEARREAMQRTRSAKTAK